MICPSPFSEARVVSGFGPIGRHRAAERYLRAENAVPISPSAAPSGPPAGHGFFGRMFPDLPPLVAGDADLEALAEAMLDGRPGDPALDNPSVPAGFTYLAQFIGHDISLDPSPFSARVADPAMRRAFRAPGLDLDGLYGAGPGPHRFLFRQDVPKFLIGMTAESKDAHGIDLPATPNDLERNRYGVPLICDHRNDDNLILAQTHLAFLKFHNKVIDFLIAQGTPSEELFDEAARLVRWHYQWIVLYDFVERLVEPGIVERTLAEGRRLYRFQSVPFMPLEFAGAVYRFGHSMVREEYSHNRIFRPGSPRLASATLERLFRFTSLSGEINGQLPGGFDVLPSNWAIDWRRWYEFNTPSTTPDFEANLSRRLGPMLTPKLHGLPGMTRGRGANLAFLNLRRGVMLGLPSGQDVAVAMRKHYPELRPLTAEEIASGTEGAVASKRGFRENTPLWFYILKEAQIRGNGQRLGPIGGRLVAEVFVGLVEGDPDSFLAHPGWAPTLPARTPGTFLMTDLLQLVGDVSPTDGITAVATL